MSSVRWAETVRCDWPDCQSEAKTIGPPAGAPLFDWKPPPGWVRFMPGWVPITPSSKVSQLADLCSIHARVTAAQIAALLQPE